jgi:hypothetical protein
VPPDKYDDRHQPALSKAITNPRHAISKKQPHPLTNNETKIDKILPLRRWLVPGFIRVVR